MQLFPRSYEPRSQFKDKVKNAIKANQPRRNVISSVMGGFVSETRNSSPINALISKLKDYTLNEKTNFSAKLDLAMCFWATNQLQHSIDLLREIFQNNPHDAEVIEYILRMMVFTKQPEDGLKFCERIPEGLKETREVPYLIGILNYMKKNTTETIDWFKKSFELAPDNLEKWNALVGVLGEAGKINNIPKYKKPKDPETNVTISMGMKGRLIWSPEYILYIPHFYSFKKELDYLKKFFNIDLEEEAKQEETRSQMEVNYTTMSFLVNFKDVVTEFSDEETPASLRNNLIRILNQANTCKDNHFYIRLWLLLLQFDFSHEYFEPSYYRFFLTRTDRIEFPFTLVQSKEFMDNLESINCLIRGLMNIKLEYKHESMLPWTIQRIFSSVKRLITLLDLEVTGSFIDDIDSNDIVEDSMVRPAHHIDSEIFLKCQTQPFDLNNIIDLIKRQKFIPFGCDKEEKKKYNYNEDDDYDERYYRYSPEKYPFGYGSGSLANSYIPSTYIRKIIERKLIEQINDYDESDFARLLTSNVGFVQKIVLMNAPIDQLSWTTMSPLFDSKNHDILGILLDKFLFHFKEIDKIFLIELLANLEKEDEDGYRMTGLYDPDRDPGVREAMHRSEGEFRHYGGEVVKCRGFYYNKHNWLTYGSFFNRTNLSEIIKERLKQEKEITYDDLGALSERLTEEITYWDNFVYDEDE